MKRTRRIALTIGTVGAAGALALTGCTSAGDPAPEQVAAAQKGDAIASIRQAADATAATGSAKFSATMSAPGISNGSEVTTIEGAFNFDKGELAAKVTGGILEQMGNIEVIVAGDSIYMKIPQIGDKWLEASSDDANGLGLDTTNPVEALEQLKSLVNLQRVGSENLDGVETTKYTGVIKNEDALDAAGAPEDKASQVGGETKMTVWVDKSDHVVQVTTDSEVKTDGQSQTVKTIMKFSDFGVDTDIKVPGPDETIGYEEALGGLASSFGQG